MKVKVHNRDTDRLADDPAVITIEASAIGISYRRDHPDEAPLLVVNEINDTEDGRKITKQHKFFARYTSILVGE